MMSESDEESNNEVEEKFKQLFQGSRFKFEGLKADTEKVFVKLVQEMGAEVSKKARNIFVQKSYFETKENNSRNYLYNIDYIMESVKAGRALELAQFMFVPDPSSKDDPMCYEARYIYKTDSCHKCYYERVFCKECIQSNQESQITTNQDRSHIIPATDSSSENEEENGEEGEGESKEEITSSPNQRAIRHGSKSPKRHISSDSEETCTEKSPVRKKLKNSSDVNNTFHKEKSPEIDVENDIENDSTRSNGNSINNSREEPVQESINGNFVKAHDVIKQKMARLKSSPRKNVEVDMEKDDDLSDTHSTHIPNSKVREYKTSTQKVKGASSSQWIDSSKSKVSPVKNELSELTESESGLRIAKAPSVKHELSDLSESGSESEISIATDEEEEKYFKEKIWWVQHEIPRKERCTIENCTFEPGDHRTHFPARRFLSLIEKKILVKYLIMKNQIHNAKGKVVYESMIHDGYLKHRSWETLRNCLRRTIIKEIAGYKLEKKVVDEFKKLRIRNTAKVKQEK